MTFLREYGIRILVFHEKYWNIVPSLVIMRVIDTHTHSHTFKAAKPRAPMWETRLRLLNGQL